MLFRRLIGGKLSCCLYWKVLGDSLYSTKYFCENVISKRADFRMSTNVYRQQQSYKATVENIFNASSSTKVLRLFVGEAGFSFKAGQWVDFYAPFIEDVTGYSMTSAPYEVKEKGILDLAVKYGKFPPTHWLHTECQIGKEVVICVGGDFYYDPQPGTPEATADLLLVGGGVGINPLVSILSEYCHILNAAAKGESLVCPGHVHLLYGAKTEEELIFRDSFTQMEKDHPSLTCQYFISRATHTSDDLKIKYHRIQETDIADAVGRLNKDNMLCFICGPSTMTDDIANILLKLGIRENFIKYEKWW